MPFVTAELPGTGGQLRQSEDDFQVEEIPAYLPSGSGQHLFAWIEKRNLTTHEAVRLLARQARVAERDIGTAGLKDKRAVTRQWISLLDAKEADLEGFSQDGSLRVLEVRRHGNKLKTGHSRGNRFRIAVRNAISGALPRAQAILEALRTRGVANLFGPQRFGRDGETAALGRALLLGEPHPELQRVQRDRALKRLALSALQSQLFNALLELRLEDGSWKQALTGDVMRKVTGACFSCQDAAVEQARVDAFEISVAGPMFGPEMLAASGIPRAIEQRVLEQLRVPEAAFARGGELTRGARRSLRIPLPDATVEEREGALWFAFSLPAGSYASVVMAEAAGRVVYAGLAQI